MAFEQLMAEATAKREKKDDHAKDKENKKKEKAEKAEKSHKHSVFGGGHAEKAATSGAKDEKTAAAS